MVGNGSTQYIVVLFAGFVFLAQVFNNIEGLSYSKRTTYLSAQLSGSCKDNTICQEGCIDTPSGLLCTCFKGRYLSIDNITCTDTPFCQQWGRCSQICHMLNTSYSCGCSLGYKLAQDNFTCISKDSFATSLILSTGTEILIYSLQNGTHKSVLSHSSKITAVDYYHSPTSDMFFWADSEIKKIFAGSLKGGSVLQNIHPIIQGGLNVVTSLAVDWIAHNLYWISDEYHQIEVSKFDGTLRTSLVDGLFYPKCLVVDSKHGFLFWIDWTKGVSKIERSSINGNHRQVIVNLPQFLNKGWPSGITLEYTTMHVYWVDSKSDSLHVVDYNGENHRRIYQDKNLPSYFFLSVFEKYIYWASQKRNLLGRINQWWPDDNEILYVSYPHLYDVKVLHPLRQPSANKNPCAYKNGHCAQLCLFDSNLLPSCACSYGWKLNKDGKTCSKYKESLMYIVQETNEKVIFFSQRRNLSHFISIPIRIDIDPYRGIIYDPNNEQVFWANRNVVKAMHHNGLIKTVLELDDIEITSLSTDSNSDNLYLLTSSVSKEENYLSVCTKKGAHFTHLIHFHFEKPLYISVDPVNRILFWSQTMKHNETYLYTIESSLLDGSSQKRILMLNASGDFNKPIRFTLQYIAQKIYLWDHDSGSLMWTTYDGSSLHVIPSIKPSAIATDDNTVIFVQNYTIYEMINGNWTYSMIGNTTKKVIHIDIIKQQSVLDRPSGIYQNCDTILIQISPNHTSCVPKIGSRPFLAFLHDGILQSSSFYASSINLFPVKLFTTSSTDDFDIDFANDMIYWSDTKAKAIFSVKSDGTQKHLLVHVDGQIGQIAFDWIKGYMYWIIKNESSIWVAPRDGKYKYVVIQGNLRYPSAIAVDPVHGYLFWTDSGAPAHIERSLLSGTQRKVLVSMESAHISCMIIDIREEMIYWTDSIAGMIQRMTLDGHNQETLISQEDGFIIHPISLAISSEYLFFTDIGYKGGSVLQAQKSNFSEVTILGENYGRNLGRIKLFDKKLQEGTNICAKQLHGCDHFCFYEGNKKYSCACAYSILGRDRKTCIEYKQFMLMAEKSKITSVSLNDPISLNSPFPPLVIGANIQNIVAVSYNRYQKRIIFSDLYQEPYLFSIKTDGTELVPLLKDNIVRSIEGLAFDEIHGDIYWTDSVRPSIFCLRVVQHGEMQHYPFEAERILQLDSRDKPRGIVLHSCNLFLFWTNWRKNNPTIERTYFTGAQREVIVSDNLVQPNGLVIDLLEETLIWTDAKLDDTYSIWSCDFDGSNRKQITLGVGHHPFDIVIHGSFLYWTDWETGALLQTEKTTGKGPAIIRSNLHHPMSLVIESPANVKCSLATTKPLLRNSFPSAGCYDYCHNDGLCIPHAQSGKLICICAENYTGSNCDVDVQSTTYYATSDDVISFSVVIAVTVVVIIIFVFIIIGLFFYKRRECCSPNGNTLPLLKNSLPNTSNCAADMTRESSFCNGSCEEDGILISPAFEVVSFRKMQMSGKETNI